MQQQPRRSRLARFAAGALVGSVLSLGAISDSASAAQAIDEPVASTTTPTQIVKPPSTSWLSGIRW